MKLIQTEERLFYLKMAGENFWQHKLAHHLVLLFIYLTEKSGWVKLK